MIIHNLIVDTFTKYFRFVFQLVMIRELACLKYDFLSRIILIMIAFHMTGIPSPASLLNRLIWKYRNKVYFINRHGSTIGFI